MEVRNCSNVGVILAYEIAMLEVILIFAQK